MIHDICQKFGLDSNGSASFSTENFFNSPKMPCYVPENAEDRHDIFSREDLTRVVEEWLDREETQEYLLETYDGVMPEINEEFINNQVINLYESLTWEYPSTYLDNLLN
jgi:hypothetical protein